MTALLDDTLVGLVVLGGFGYAIYSLGPKGLRARLLTSTASLLGRLPTSGVRGVVERMTRAAGKAKSSCGGCGNCGPNEAAMEAAAGDGSGPVREITVPLTDIGKRR